MTRNGSALELRGITKHFGRLRVLDDISTVIDAGSFTAILGPSGSGKSTLLMTIAGFEMPDSGAVIRDGVEVTRIAPEKRDIGVVFQGYALFPHLTVADNIAFPLRARGWEQARANERVREMAALVEIGELLARYPAQLSGGQRQRVAIARSLAFQPKLLLLDEPLSALDRGLRDRMQAELQRLHRKLGVTIVMVTHDQDEASALADNVIVMEAGALVAKGSARRLYEEPGDARIAAFFGRANFLPFQQSADGKVVEIFGYRLAPSTVEGFGDALLVRPEAFEISGQGKGIEVEIVSTVFHAGRVTLSCLTPAGQTILAELPDERAGALSVGDRIALAITRCRFVHSIDGNAVS
ncbi:MAG: ABC transporter ATP-binding protein [Mesorhizobium sp.]